MDLVRIELYTHPHTLLSNVPQPKVGVFLLVEFLEAGDTNLHVGTNQLQAKRVRVGYMGFGRREMYSTRTPPLIPLIH
jgi:hypothetical protein